MAIRDNAIALETPLRRPFPRAALLHTCMAAFPVFYIGALSSAGISTAAIGMVAAVAVSSLLSSIAGFAFSAICGAIMFHFRQDAVGLVQIMLVCSIANQTMSVWLLRRDIRTRTVLPFLFGGLLGAPIGVWLLLSEMRVLPFRDSWPLILVALGVHTMWKALRPAQARRSRAGRSS